MKAQLTNLSGDKITIHLNKWDENTNIPDKLHNICSATAYHLKTGNAEIEIQLNDEDELKVSGDPIVNQVIDKFQQRSQLGIQKYSTTLYENNTDDFLNHLQEELMDAILYIQKLKQNENS